MSTILCFGNYLKELSEIDNENRFRSSYVCDLWGWWKGWDGGDTFWLQQSLLWPMHQLHVCCQKATLCNIVLIILYYWHSTGLAYNVLPLD